MIPLNIEDLKKHLQELKYDAQIQEATGQLYVILKRDNREFPLFVKTDGSVLQMIIFLPFKVLPQAFPDTGRLLHFFNKEIDLPGFGMDEDQGVVFYRCALPTADQKVDPALFNNILISMQNVSEGFLPFIFKVASGNSDFETVAKKAKEALQRLSK